MNAHCNVCFNMILSCRLVIKFVNIGRQGRWQRHEAVRGRRGRCVTSKKKLKKTEVRGRTKRNN